ncbi:MAG: alkaline phosphatase [Spirochaetales bacterium]|nr:alkaline phosphatase [Spirochaetales bacterium]
MKRFLSLLLIVLMMFTVVFVTVACKEEAAPAATPEPEPTPDKTTLEHCDPILPKGTGAVIPTWDVDDNGVKDLPAYVVNFAGSSDSKTNVTAELIAAVKKAQEDELFKDQPVNNVILLIGDGMGMSHLEMSKEYKGDLLMYYLPYFTQSLTDSYEEDPSTNRTNKVTTDSSAGGTQILTGYKTRYGYISIDIDRNIIPNLTDVAAGKGWKTACITNDHIGDATPADTTVHNSCRDHQAVIYFQELMMMYEGKLDLLMGADWDMGPYFDSDNTTWAKRMDAAELKGLADAMDEISNLPALTDDPKDYYAQLSADQKAKVYEFSVNYYVWATYTDKSVPFEDWVGSETGLEAWCASMDTAFNPSEDVSRFSDFKKLAVNTDFSDPVLGSYSYSNPKTLSSKVGYQETSKTQPNYPEMVAYTLYQMDKMATDASTGFFCMIENTYPDGWGHKQIAIGAMNEVQNFDEGVAIAVKYVLEHPDTLLIVTADHETGGFNLNTGWKTNITKIKSTTSGHSSKPVPCIAFGAGAEAFSAANIAAKYPDFSQDEGKTHEGWITGALIGQAMGVADFGQPTTGYPAAL